MPFALAIVVAAIVGGLIAIIIEKFGYGPLMARGQVFLSFVAALAIAYVLEIWAPRIWGVETQVFPQNILPDPVVSIGGVDLRLFPIFSLVIAIAVVIAFQLYLDRSKGGRAIRAVADGS